MRGAVGVIRGDKGWCQSVGQSVGSVLGCNDTGLSDSQAGGEGGDGRRAAKPRSPSYKHSIPFPVLAINREIG